MAMEVGKICGRSNMNFLLKSEQISSSSELMKSICLPSSSSALQGEKGIINYENVNGDDIDLDGCFHPPGKKRRLTVKQVQFLEKSFEVENKLELDRKVQLAKELGLQPRQVAIWFQNRRARFKNKQLEKDYDSLKASYDKLMADYDLLLKEKDDLQNEVLALKEDLLIREKGTENSSNLRAGKPNSDDDASNVPLLACNKQEESCSAKSDVFDSDSPRYVDSSNVFEPEQSDYYSQDDEDNLSLHPPSLFFPKFELDCYYDAPANSCNFALPVEDQSFWSSLY